MAHHTVKGILAAALLSGAVAAAVIPGAGTAHARGWPGCPGDPKGPCRWCPGDPPVRTGNMVNDPVIWDTSVCHTYFYVNMGDGNVAKEIWDGDNPPAPPPPPPPMPGSITTREQCEQILGMFCPHA
ncbi:hypothetical protein [Mycolicibacterium aubagnense]|uniref:DUF732 domain-containing protein n=1 Tax=Mycolicibacterium aubagnense TaxID=319707 RepID=A0ABM7IGI8_9MYCO|nr:hypothetical protein [Mycolicibacterium aubagnense]WGI32571.1 hypothetical protein QDT91_25965 [Mycolicibacterium aubagnense]BBX85841.1 hypothetical protein MAUB_37140 [Mycolicibacterium aubagnense]